MLLVGARTVSRVRGWQSGAFYLFNEQPDGDLINRWSRYQKEANPTEAYMAGTYRVPLPYGITAVESPLSACTYLGRSYFCGGHTYNLVMDEHFRVWKQGLRGPETAPSISGAAGSGNIAYTSWYDELTGERSPLSAGTTIGGGTPRTWTLAERPPDDVVEVDGSVTWGGLGDPANYFVNDAAAHLHFLRPGDRIAFGGGATPSYHMMVQGGADPGVDRVTTDQSGAAASGTVRVLPFIRATHQELWLSVAGGLPSLVMRVPVGVTSVVESVAPGDLGETFSGSFERFPRCTMNAIWNDRQILAGDPMNPDTVYLSALFYPERYEGTYFRTRSGDPVTGLLAMRDYMLVFTKTQTYRLTGYTTDDFQLTLEDASLGAVGHRSNVAIHGSAYVWTGKGPYMYNGSWHALSPENEFRTPDPWAHWSRAIHDQDWKTYGVVTAPLSLGSTEYLIDTADVEIPIPGSTLNYTSWKVAGPSVLVFDYSTVQPEVGGQLAPARMSIDSFKVSLASDIILTDYAPFYVIDKWGQGRLYSSTPIAGDGDWSFTVSPHYLSSDVRRYEGLAQNIYGTDYVNFMIVWGHKLFDQPGVCDVEGKVFTKLWFDMRHFIAYDQLPTCRLYLLGGDDDTLGHLTNIQLAQYPTYISIPPLRGAGNLTSPTYARTVHEVSPEGLSGAGLSWVLIMEDLGRGGSFRGFGGYYAPGPATQIRIEIGGT